VGKTTALYGAVPLTRWRRFPQASTNLSYKKTKRVANGVRAASIPGFLRGLPLMFQRAQAAGLDATYHLTFTGEEEHRVSIIIRNQTLQLLGGDIGTPDLQIVADSRTWLRFLAKEVSLLWALLRRRIPLKGSPRLLLAFGRCFPS
jgi:hypothetical protein